MFPVLVDKKFKGKMKGASPALFTFELQFSVKQIDQFFSYRQSESCPPVFARRIYVGWVKLSKISCCLLEGIPIPVSFTMNCIVAF